MEKSTELFAAISFLVIGLSHVAQPRAWVDLFIRLRELGHPGVFAVAFMSLPFGTFIVAFHNVWTGLPIVLTILGWAQVLKGAPLFHLPASRPAQPWPPLHHSAPGRLLLVDWLSFAFQAP